MEKKISIHQVSQMLDIPKDTLRYYDKLALVRPQRGENDYRYYTQENLLDLQYIEVMKYSEFSLKEISKILSNKYQCNEDNLDDTMNLLENKKRKIEKKIEVYQDIIELISDAKDFLDEKKPSTDPAVLNKMIIEIFNGLKGENNEK